MRFATAQGFNAGEQFFAYLKDAFDVLYAEGPSNRKCSRWGYIDFSMGCSRDHWVHFLLCPERVSR
jgi:hypothetical protein